MDDMSQIFALWPTVIPRVGSVVTSFGETIPFVDYLLTKELILLVRSQPDAQGTRRVVMKLADIVSIKIQDAIDPERFLAMGFQKHTASQAVKNPGSSGR